MFIKDGRYSAEVHHNSHLAVGVPGTVAGLHLAWKEQGKLPWKRLVEPAVALARDGFMVTEGLARSLKGALRQHAEVSGVGRAVLEERDALRSRRDAEAAGPRAHAGPHRDARAPPASTRARPRCSLEKEMLAHGGLITREDLKNYAAKKRTPVKGTYRGYEVISMPPASSGGVALIEMLNVLEGYDLAAMGFASANTVHLMAEAMKRAYADRAHYLGDPDFNKDMPIDRLTSKDYAADLRKTIDQKNAAKTSPTTFEWPHESDETTHISVVDGDRNAVSMTYTLEQGYGVEDRRARRRLPAEQRDGRLQRRLRS